MSVEKKGRGVAVGRTSMTSSFSHGDGISDSMVRGGNVRKPEADDSFTMV